MLINEYRKLRVMTQQLLGKEPIVLVETKTPTEFHGNNYCGWAIPKNSLQSDSVVVDVGLGEDVSFSQSLITQYGCVIHGFDPTPRAISYIKRLDESKITLHEYGVAAKRGQAVLYMPNNDAHVSGSLSRVSHLAQDGIEVSLIELEDIFSLIGASRINLLKLDIEGAEFDLIGDERFMDYASRIDCLCIEFHHRWPNFGKVLTLNAVERLRRLGFQCAWRSKSSNEEFTFVKFSARL